MDRAEVEKQIETIVIERHRSEPDLARAILLSTGRFVKPSAQGLLATLSDEDLEKVLTHISKWSGGRG
jgi:hypothetical protein